MAHFSLIPHTICYYIYPFYFDMKEIKKNVGHFAANGAGSHRKSGDPTNRKLHLPSRGRQRFIAAIWITAGSIAALVFIIFFAISQGWIGYVPAVEQLENPIDRYATQLISADGKSLGSFSYSQDNRFYASYQDRSPDLVQELIATDDVRFKDHSGIDVRGLFRAIVKRGLMGQRSGGGGSTITQQLAKQLYSPSVESLTERLLQKPIEWVIAVRLERYYTKEEIINMYLNKFDFLHNAVGIRSAAQSYFGKTPATLTTEEAAMLIGMCKNPSYYNPIRYPERTLERRNTVFRQMVKAGFMTEARCEELSAKPIVLHYTQLDHTDGIAPYFREYLRVTMMAKKPERSDYSKWQQQKYLDDSLAWETNPLYGWCNKNRKANGDPYNLYTDGLKVYTTIDSRMQQYAEEAIAEHLGKHLQPAFFREKRRKPYAPFSEDITEKQRKDILDRAMKQSDRYRALKQAGYSEKKIRENFNEKVEMQVFTWKGIVDTTMSPMDSIIYCKSLLRTAFMAMDVRTGQVKAYVGGINFDKFRYDMVTTGRRQIGSTMKPYLYSLAMIEGFTPCDQLLHVQPVLYDEGGNAWIPRNPGARRIGEMVTVQWGLQVSSNWVTAYLMKQLSPYSLVRLLRSYGMHSHIDPVVSICLGTPDISVSEMVSGYSVFANKGIRVEPLYVTRIEDSFGNTIATFAPQVNEVLPEEAAYKMLYMLRSVVDGGTAGRVRYGYDITAQMGGKTGTTQNNSDGWYMGFTPSLVAGCWVGGEDRSIHFDKMDEGQGAAMALPIYGLFMKKVYADKKLGYSQSETFDVPKEYANPCRGYVPMESDYSNHTGIDDLFN